ncbi:sulfotransferase [Rhodoplanes sp. TEM]|uniref:Sulfotransferase n=1 Tax=Rhodoplanes tepidamans TaxID=200616 RepID=A0ABT5J4T0_RHOTP|nr:MULTISPECIES: sulfotransferase [Rhodoplanes]MDC7784324.1 sulfotransferase [Rhodoplanes tepidamans]MDC7983412.1 sulfotransferase [Rhodoplanes sp. TEM]MDQ0354548.1 hypothetical protein [Rhodoplanes tepidamans]
MRDLLVTGVPRSGTTLAAALIDSCANAVCLSEPDHQVRLSQESGTADAFAERLRDDLRDIRTTLRSGGTVLDRRAADGGPVTNYFSTARTDGTRRTDYTLVARAARDLPEDFLLAVKHNALFTAALPELSRHSGAAIVAIVRDPVATILSWRSLDLPVSGGRLPAAERFWPAIRIISETDVPLIDKHVLIIEAFCRRYADLVPAVAVLHYESLTADPDGVLARLGLDPTTAARDLIAVAAPVRPATAEAVDIARRIREMARTRGLPGLLTFYPEYGTDR